MKVGDYVRTRWGCIAKFEGIHEGFYEFDNIIMDESSAVREELFVDIVEKSSPNIIDLIEVGDIIKFGYVYTQTKEVKNIKVHRIKNEADLTLQKFYFNNEKRVLKSIVTKEQFESMEYKIGE